MDDCVFCKISAGKMPASIVHEDAETIAFLDIHPIAPGHVLVMPRAHHATVTEIPPELLQKTALAVQKVARRTVRAMEAEGFNLLVNNGRVSGQLIPHVHFHVIPRKAGDGVRYNWNPSSPSPQQLEEVREKILAVPEG